ncbi:MAG: hypothetical protein DMF61_22820 [Blastocatellia bacterium AA13]|nr:MAG: hypothetical protein DMF61_22820 [Blastocatellia bacterium AA13]
MQSLFTIILLQATRTSLSKPVIIGAALFLILAIFAVVYFFKRVKNTEKEAEDDWTSAGAKLFAVDAPSASSNRTEAQAIYSPAPQPEPVVHEEAAPVEPPSPITEVLGETRPAAFEDETTIVHESPAAIVEVPGVPTISPEESSATLESASPFDDEIWAELGESEAPLEAPLAGMIDAHEDEADAPLAGMVRGAEVTRPPSRAALLAASAETVERSTTAEPHSPGAAKSGSILGLPAEPSAKPFVLGKATSQVGVGTITNYGKPVDDEGGKGGTITLAVVVLIIGGAVAAFFLSPRVHSSVTDWVAKMRGGAAVADEPAKAQVFPFRPELSKEKPQAVAKGTVSNISNQDLTGLAVEVSLTRKDNGPSENRRIAISPDTIAPNQQGVFEFELEPTQYTGYKVNKLFNSEGKEIKFTTPAQQK